MNVHKLENDCLDLVVLVLVRQGVCMDSKISFAHRIPFDSALVGFYQLFQKNYLEVACQMFVWLGGI